MDLKDCNHGLMAVAMSTHIGSFCLGFPYCLYDHPRMGWVIVDRRARNGLMMWMSSIAACLYGQYVHLIPI